MTSSQHCPKKVSFYASYQNVKFSIWRKRHTLPDLKTFLFPVSSDPVLAQVKTASFQKQYTSPPLSSPQQTFLASSLFARESVTCEKFPTATEKKSTQYVASAVVGDSYARLPATDYHYFPLFLSRSRKSTPSLLRQTIGRGCIQKALSSLLCGVHTHGSRRRGRKEEEYRHTPCSKNLRSSNNFELFFSFENVHICGS